MGNWRIVDAQAAAQVTAAHGRLILNSTTEVHLTHLHVILVGPETALGATVIAELARFRVPMLHCDWRGVPTNVTLPWSPNSRVAARHRAQAKLAEPRRKNAWMQVVRAKLRGQATVLDPIACEQAMTLRRLAQATRSGDPENTEGQGARIYWPALFGPRFIRVTGTREGVNGALDYGYTIVRGLVLREVVTAGLWPTLGLHHRTRSNPTVLTDDLIEPFRPPVDHLVHSLHSQTPIRGPITRSCRQALLDVVSTPFASKAGQTLGSAIESLTRDYARYVEGRLQTLTPPRWTGPTLEDQ